MRRRIATLALIMLVVSCSGPGREKNPFLGKRVVFLGDSITEDGRYVSVIEYALFTAFPRDSFDVISLGLSSETVSGLTEPGHRHPRPNLHDRLDAVLRALKPDVVVACYGMNDGIYHPNSEERFEAYRKGIRKLIDRVKETGAEIILLTPPVFDAAAIPERVVGRDSEAFGYSRPYAGYDSVLAEYSRWLLTLREPGVRVIDIHGPMRAYLDGRRAQELGFTLSPDGVHPDFTGHVLMAQVFLRGMGIPCPDLDPEVWARELETSDLYQKVHRRRSLRSGAWLVATGIPAHRKIQALPVDSAEVVAAQLAREIRDAAADQ